MVGVEHACGLDSKRRAGLSVAGRAVRTLKLDREAWCEACCWDDKVGWRLALRSLKWLGSRRCRPKQHESGTDMN